MKIITLKNGFRIALNKVDYLKTAAIYLYIASGNCYENEKTAGASHFIEHLLFKGTSDFSDEDLARKIDWLGGRFNAYTGKEYTCIYAHVLDESVGTGLELLFKMATDSILPSSAVETERGVILEEINMYEDSPEDLAMDGLISYIFADSPLRFNILGSRESVSEISHNELESVMKKYYTPERMVLSVCGNFDENEIIELAEKYIGVRENSGFPIVFPETEMKKGGIIFKKKDFEQTQILINTKGASYSDKNRYAFSAFSAIAGGNASSRLNLTIRERLGLAYSVGTFLLPFKNTGLFMLSAGTAHKNQLKVIEKALEEMEKIPDTISEEELSAVKQQFKVSCVMGNERISALASGVGRDLLYLNDWVSIEDSLKMIEALTLEDVVNVAKSIWNKERLTLSIVGKPQNIKEYEKLGFKA